MTGDHLVRVFVAANAENGLETDSEIEIDKLQAVRAERIDRLVGQASEGTMAMVDEALSLWLDL